MLIYCCTQYISCKRDKCMILDMFALHPKEIIKLKHALPSIR